MKHGLFSICCLICIILSCISCQKTPDKEVVIDKSQGLPKDSILDKQSTPKELGAPQVWQESVEKGEISVQIDADCRIDLPEVYNTPVYELEMQHMSGKMLEKLCTYFADGNELYQLPEMTKDQLEKERSYLQESKGEWAFDDSDIIENKLKKIDELSKNAPKEIHKKPIKFKLSKPVRTEYEYIQEASGSVARRNSKFYFDTDEEIGFRARVDKETGVDPFIYVVDYNKDVGSTTHFLFQQGRFTDEKELEKNLKISDLSYIGSHYGDYLKWIETEMNREECFTISKEEAIERCDKVLADLGLDDYVMTNCCKAVGNGDSESMAGVNQDERITDYGYSLYYNRKAGELAGYEQPVQQPFNNLPEEVYAPPFATEQIHIVVTGKGVLQFEWNNLSSKKDTITENTKLLTFDEVKGKLYDHLLYVSLAKNGEKDYGDIYHYQIHQVKLRAANVPAYENPQGAWLVPVWVFEVSQEITFKTLGASPASDMTVVLNAIDGGYIQPNVDPRIKVD